MNKRFFELGLEFAGGFGPATTGDLRSRPPKVDHLNFEFDIWPNDPIVEFVSIFIVTNVFRDLLIANLVSGVEFAAVEISKAGIFEDLYPNGPPLPRFVWLKIIGRAGKDDFGLAASQRLVVSDRVMKLIDRLSLKHCRVINIFEIGDQS